MNVHPLPMYAPLPMAPRSFQGFPSVNNPSATEGIGVLVWISGRGGLIDGGNIGLVSFEVKDFCDQAIPDLTSMLRNGFVLKFQAVLNQQIPIHSKVKWCATFVTPLLHADRLAIPGVLQAMVKQLVDSLDLGKDASFGEDPTRKVENYGVDLEARALKHVLSVFQTMRLVRLPLGTLHCYISNCGAHEVYHYIGTSSTKRRQFFEKRTHIFNLRCLEDDIQVQLVLPPIYSTIFTLSQKLMISGGAMPLQELYEIYLSCAEIPLDARDIIGEGKPKFLQLLLSHAWVFAVFPSRVFVSLRRKLVQMPYEEMWQENDFYEFYADWMSEAIPATNTNGSTSTSMDAAAAWPPQQVGGHLNGSADAANAMSPVFPTNTSPTGANADTHEQAVGGRNAFLNSFGATNAVKSSSTNFSQASHCDFGFHRAAAPRLSANNGVANGGWASPPNGVDFASNGMLFTTSNANTATGSSCGSPSFNAIIAQPHGKASVDMSSVKSSGTTSPLSGLNGATSNFGDESNRREELSEAAARIVAKPGSFSGFSLPLSSSISPVESRESQTENCESLSASAPYIIVKTVSAEGVLISETKLFNRSTQTETNEQDVSTQMLNNDEISSTHGNATACDQSFVNAELTDPFTSLLFLDKTQGPVF